MATSTPATFADLLEQAVNDPGILSGAYRAFHSYSLGNRLLAWGQCIARGIQPGPIATFPRWRELGRYVRKGEKAITLCQPVTVKRTVEDDQRQEEEIAFTRFTYKPKWFVLAQTDGQPVPEPSGTHRSIWTQEHGPIPSGLVVRHRCANARCVRVDHLELGTPLDNARDMARRGRAKRNPSGEENSNARLTAAEVEAVRSRWKGAGKRWGLQTALADEFGVSQTTISMIVRSQIRRG